MENLSIIQALMSLASLLLAGILALWGTIVFLLKQIESNRIGFQSALDRVEADIRRSLDHSKEDNNIAHQTLRESADSIRRELDKKIGSLDARQLQMIDKVYRRLHEKR